MNSIKYGPSIKTKINGTINSTEMILTLLGILFICSLTVSSSLSLRKSTSL